MIEAPPQHSLVAVRRDWLGSVLATWHGASTNRLLAPYPAAFVLKNPSEGPPLHARNGPSPRPVKTAGIPAR